MAHVRKINVEDLRKRVEALIQEGLTMPAVEEWIGRLRVNDEAKAAVWLYAWSLQPPACQRADALGMLAAVRLDPAQPCRL